jgi:hypothetical protein
MSDPAVAPADIQLQNLSSTPLGQESGGNPIIGAVGPRFGLIPRIYPFNEGCGSPSLPQQIHVVPLPQAIENPLQVKQVVAQTASLQPVFQSTIPQQTFLCFQNWTSGVLANQEFKDANSKQVWKISDEHCCLMKPVLKSYNAQNQELGNLEWGKPPCVTQLMYCLCAIISRTPTVDEYAWLRAVDGYGKERLTFREPAKEGRCLCFDLCKTSYTVTQAGCCANLPDQPFYEQTQIYGPMGDPTVVGSIEVRGAYGYDTECGCAKVFGVRPEVVTQVSVNPNLSYEDTVLAVQMALQRTQSKFEYWGRDQITHRYPFLKPAGQAMQ